MKTWEMIKNLTENPKLRFECKSESGHCNTVCADNGWLKSESSYYINCNFNTEWEIIRDPVDFIEAYKAWNDGKIIKFISPRNKVWIYQKNNGNSNLISLNDVDDGKWFIEK